MRRHHRTTRVLQSRRRILSYPITLATVVVDGDAMDMKLPADPLPVPKKLPSVAEMLNRTPDAVRHVAFEICGNKEGVIMQDPDWRIPSCGWYFAKYDAKYWGGKPLNTLLLMRDDDDTGKPSKPPEQGNAAGRFQESWTVHARRAAVR